MPLKKKPIKAKKTGSLTGNNATYILQRTFKDKRKSRQRRVTNRTKKRVRMKRAQEKKEFWLKILFLLCLAMGALLYWLHFGSTFNITKIHIQEVKNSTNATIPNDIVHLVEKIRGQNIFNFNEAEIINHINNTHPEISEVVIKKNLPSTITLMLSYYEEMINVLVESEGSASPHKAIVNRKGSVAKNHEHNPMLPIFTLKDLSSTEFDEIVGETIIFDTENIDSSLTILSKLQAELNFTITEIHFYKIAREAHFKIEDGPWLWFDLTKDIDDQIKKVALLTQVNDVAINTIEYVDLRLGSQNGKKVIIKRGIVENQS